MVRWHTEEMDFNSQSTCGETARTCSVHLAAWASRVAVMRSAGPRHFINRTAVQRGPLTEHETGQSLLHTDASGESGNIMEHKH